MSSSNIKDDKNDKNMGSADKDQRNKEQRGAADKQGAGQRQQSTGQPGSANVQQGGHSDDHRHQQGHQGGGKPADNMQSNDPNRKGGKT